MQEEGEGERMRRRREEEREKGFKGEGREKERKERRKEGREERRKEEEREEGRKGGGKEEERALLASVVHVARALYMNVTQDVAVGLSCILCTTPPDYTEYHARLRSIIRNTMHTSDRFARFFMKIANKFA